MNTYAMEKILTIAERILLMFSRSIDAQDCIPCAQEKHNIENGLDGLLDAFPSLRSEISGKCVLDYGCGPGWQSVCLARLDTHRIVGIDVSPTRIEHAQAIASRFHVAHKMEAHIGWSDDLTGQFDIVISKDSFEHYRHPELALAEMKKALRPNGKLYIVFSWPWYSPLGSHMQFFTLLPWVNLIFSEKTIMRVRSHYRNDGAMRYEDVKSGLNKMTVRRFENIIRSNDLLIESQFLRGFKKWHFLTRIPLLRELFTQQVGSILSLPSTS
ncbi:MAG: class I SAM-dependent methyltransferase [Candidatus Electrothrix sp. AW3_4]|nr:class I SAM-dependent methyltransferase [Candidatus Electrothrix gigas]